MNATDRPMMHAQVATTIVDDRAVIILADDGDVKILNPVGTRIWSLIDGNRTIADIACVIGGEFDVSSDVAAQDAREFIQTLVDVRAVALKGEL